MKFSEIVDYPRPWPKKTHPVVGHVYIKAEKFDELSTKVADQAFVRLLGHDEGGDGLLVAHVACTTKQALNLFNRRWTVRR